MAKAAVQTVVIPETNIAIPVAWPHQIDGKQRPTFVINDPANTVADVVSVRLTEAEVTLLAEYGAYEVAEIVRPKPANEIRIGGFPGLPDRLSGLAPVGGSETTITEVDSVEEGSFTMPAKLATGYSGSAISTNGKLCGVYTGSEATGKGLAVTLAVYAGKLFS